MKKYDLEDRLILFSVSIINLSDLIDKTKAGNHLSGQIIRSGTSVALNYGEAQSSESKKDFIHKFKIILKELRETLVCLKIVEQSNLIQNTDLIESVKDECGQLISIFVRSIETAQKNN